MGWGMLGWWGGNAYGSSTSSPLPHHSPPPYHSQSRGTDTTMGTGVGGTVTNEGIPSGKEAEAEEAAKTPMTKIAEGVNEAINNTVESITGTDKR